MSAPFDLYGEIRQALAHPGAANMVGVDTVRADGDGLYVPDSAGPILAAIVAVMPGNEIIDLIAIDLAQPKRWRRRIGVADLLGEANLSQARDKKVDRAGSRYALWIELIANCWLCCLGARGWPKSENRVANSRGYD